MIIKINDEYKIVQETCQWTLILTKIKEDGTSYDVNIGYFAHLIDCLKRAFYVSERSFDVIPVLQFEQTINTKLNNFISKLEIQE